MSTTKPKLTFDDLYTKQTEALYNLVMSSDQKWRQKWADDGFSQRNADTDKGYSNMNQTLLFNRAVQENLDDPRWLTFAQAKEHGYQIKKGAKSSEIFRLLDQTYERKVKDENGNVLKDENGKDLTETVKYNQRLIVKHNVFNARDIDGIEPFKRAEIPEEHKQLLKQENYKNAEIMISAFCQSNGISLQEMASEKAFYANNEFFHRGNNGVTEHKVVLPLKAQFDNLDDYFSVAFHEVAHSTKVLDIRINKATDTPTGNEFGSKNYAKEELTAELTALFLCRQFGINSTDIAERENNSLAYLKTWINQGVLDKDDFFVAVKEANRATRAIAEYAPKITLSLDDLTKTESISQNINTDKTIIQDIVNVVNKTQELSQGLSHYINDKLYPEKPTANIQLIEFLSKTLGDDKLSELRKEADNYLRQDLNNKKPKKFAENKKQTESLEQSNTLDLENMGLIISVTKAIEKDGAYFRADDGIDYTGKEAFDRLRELLATREPFYVHTQIENKDFENIGLQKPLINSVSDTLISEVSQNIHTPFEFIKHQFEFLNDTSVKDNVTEILNKYIEQEKQYLAQEDNYAYLKEKAINLNNGSSIDIDFAETLLEKNNPLSPNEKAVMQASIGFDNYRDLELRADTYLTQWEKLKELMTPPKIDDPSNIEKVAWIISETENKVELKAVVGQILEDNHNQGKINQEQYDTLYNTYFDKINHYEKFKEVEKIRDDLYQLWQKWENREDFAQFLKLTEFERQPNIDPLTQEKAYFTSLIDEFKQTGDWQKLTGDNKNNLSMEEQIKNDFTLYQEAKNNNNKEIEDNYHSKLYRSFIEHYQIKDRYIDGVLPDIYIDEKGLETPYYQRHFEEFMENLEKGVVLAPDYFKDNHQNGLNLNEIGLSVKFKNERYTGEEAYLLLEHFRNEQPFKPETDHREMISIELKNTDVHSVSLYSIIAVKEHLQNNPESIFNGLKSLNEAFGRNAVDISQKLTEYANIERENGLIFTRDISEIQLKNISQEEPQKKDTFAQQIESIFTKGSIETATLLRVANDNKTFTNSNGFLNLDLTNKKDPYQEYVDNGYLKLVKESGINGFVKTYELTEKGKNTVNEMFDKVIAQENEKHGAKVTKKDVETLIDKLYSSHRNHAGGTEDEFRQSSFPESIIPKLDEAEKLLERPFNKHSLPYKEQLNNVIKLSNEYLEKWDNLNKNTLIDSEGDRLLNIKLLWSEKVRDENLSFGTDLKKLEDFMWRNYVTHNESNPLSTKGTGYDKWKFEFTYQKATGEIEKKECRIDIGKGQGDFNPHREDLKEYIERQIIHSKFVEQTPKLSAEIRQELKQQQAEALQVKQQSKGMTIH